MHEADSTATQPDTPSNPPTGHSSVAVVKPTLNQPAHEVSGALAEPQPVQERERAPWERDWSSLDAVLFDCWQMLHRGQHKSADPFHTPALATQGEFGISVRTVVLRRVQSRTRQIFCHTDVRSDKVKEIQHQPRISWLFYHPKDKVQLRFSGLATLHRDDALAQEQWDKSTTSSRRCYMSLTGPGQITDRPSSGLPADLDQRVPSLAESEVGWEHFAVLCCTIDFLDAVYLRARGHIRAQFHWLAGKSVPKAQWVTP